MLVIFFTALLLPPLGVVVGIFSPAPLIIISLKRGKHAGLITTGLVFLALLMATGIQQALFFVAEYAVLAIIIAEMVRQELSFDKCILFSVIGSAILSGLLLILVFSGKEVSLTEFLQQQVKTHFEQSLEALKTVKQDDVDLATMEQFMEKTSRSFAASYPAIIVVGSLMGALLNYSLARWVMQRFYAGTCSFVGSFSVWVLPDFIIWIFILSAGSLFFPDGELESLGLNFFIVTAAVYGLQGMAVVVHFLDKKSVPVLLWIIVFILIFSQPLLIGALLGLGLFDLWLDFRKLRVKPVVED
ncbi:MAG: DUF2232 domain-containing protein [Nitrospinota bacterium]|nr:DUF2232 domain-containing protein [Nitrospinota bacterium]